MCGIIKGSYEGKIDEKILRNTGWLNRAKRIEAFKKDIANYKWSKGAVQFPFDKPLPLALITRVVKFRVRHNQEKTMEKIKQKKPQLLKK